MKRYNITVPKEYEKNGEVKTAWNRVGTLVRFPATETKDEGFILELNMYPNTKFAVFEDKPQEEKEETIEDSGEDISADDIPF